MRKYTNSPIFVTLFSCILLLVACEKNLDYQLTNQDPLVVMYAFPMPDSTLQLHASYSTQILSTDDYEAIQGLKYTISINETEIISGDYPSGEEWLLLPYVKNQINDSIHITYLLEDGTNISGCTTIPDPVQILDIDTAATPYVNDEGNSENMLGCTLKFNDPATDENYYQIRVDYVDHSSTSQTNNIETIDYIKQDNVFLIRDDESVLLTNVDFLGTFTDHTFNGENTEINFLIPEKYLNNNAHFIIYLYTLTQEYYQFIRTTLEEEAFRDYPIFEPVNIYTNIENGIGVVAGLAADTCSISLK